jgi:branched-subunit amino acid ABC-type transport system permease component
VSTFLSYALPGIPYGCDFALLAVGLVLTYRATGVFNLAFGAQAFAAAFAFDLLVRSAHLPVWLAFVLSVLVLSPAIGLAADRFLFRFIPTASVTAKLVSSLGLLIAIPFAIPIIFTNAPRINPPYLWLNPNHVYFHLGSTPINGGEMSTVIITVVVVGAVMAMFRWTSIGLQMRAVVESRRLSQLEGISAPSVAAGAWALSSTLAGLAGVLLLPLQAELSATNTYEFTSLLVAGLTAAAIASMRSLSIALAAAIGLGVVENLLKGYLPPGTLSQSVVATFPFVVLVGTLLLNPGLRRIEMSTDPLASCDPPLAPPSVTIRDRRLERPMRVAWWVLLAAFLLSCLTWVPGVWVGTFNQGLGLSMIFLSVTLITGMSGQISLCQATFAGVGAFTAGQLGTHMGLPFLLGAVVGGLLAAAVGTVIAVLAVRVSGLLLALVTLSFALFADTLLFQYSWSGGGLAGVTVPRPVLGPIDFGSDRTYLLLCFVALVLCIVLVKLVQLGTVGRYLAAMRGSPVAAASMGISLTTARLTVFAMSAGLAGFGGAFYGGALAPAPVDATTFNYVVSLVWVVAVITVGSRTVEGAVQAGMGFGILTLILTYLPLRLAGLAPILFAAGALTYAVHPEGVVEYQRSKWMRRVNRVLRRYDERHTGGTDGGVGIGDAAVGTTIPVAPPASVSSSEVIGG